MKKLLLLTFLVLGSFSVNAQLSCAAPVVLTTSGTYTVATITGDNTVDGCFQDVTDINNDPMHSNWYSYTAATSGDVSIVADGTTETSISILTGTCSALECFQNTGLNGGSSITFKAVAGTTYFILFDSFFSAESFNFIFEISTCASVANVNDPADVTFTSATLSWDAANGNPLQYEVEYGPIGFTPGEGVFVKTYTNSLDLKDLTTSGNYDYYIRSLCGGSDKSLWNGPNELALIKTVPYYTGYDNFDELAGLRVEGDWNNTFYIDYQDGVAQSPDLYVVFNNNATTATNNWVYTPAISLTAGQVINASFYVYTTSLTANRSLKITYGSDQDMTTQNTTIYSNTALNGTSTTEYTLVTTPDFIVPASGIYYFGINDFSPINADPTSMLFDTFTINTGALATNDFVSNQFSIFPNPVKNVVNITNSADINVSAVAITDLNGRIIKRQSYNNISNINMNVSDLAAGVYMMNITSDKGTATKKIIKN